MCSYFKKDDDDDTFFNYILVFVKEHNVKWGVMDSPKRRNMIRRNVAYEGRGIEYCCYRLEHSDDPFIFNYWKGLKEELGKDCSWRDRVKSTLLPVFNDCVIKFCTS